MYRAVVFDMDGVLIDSEPVYMERMRAFLVSLKQEAPLEQLTQLVGTSSKVTWDLLYKWSGESMPKEEFIACYRRFVGSLPPICYSDILFSDVKPVLSALYGRLPLAVASSSPPENIRNVLTSCGIRHYFDKTVSGDMFAQSKPNPEIYLYTAKALGIAPEECIAVEDSPLGIRAARAAGYYVVARKDARFGFDQSVADAYVSRFEELQPLVERLAAFT